MNKVVDYFMHPQSPWSCLGHDELRRICALHNADIHMKPIDLGNKVFPVSGGLPLAKRAPQRQDYRFVELERWRAKREVPINLRPKFFPANADTACRLIIAADKLHGADAALGLAGRLMRATWCEERNVADDHTLRAVLHEAGLPADPLFHALPDTHQVFDAYTQEAVDRGVFGVPWYVYKGVPYWGQDRLEFLEQALGA
ncbi:MAG: 2-hydroxychromene-2-carboxylate isomerase [Burkholderiaceae bacterium]|nr:2-hydroxychromene-2-carboxylate isomerase [Burkholderiaceae bacterium]